MKKVRIISRLDIKSANVIKGIQYEGLRIVGDPDTLSQKYYNQGADEMLYIDTVASLYGRNNLLDVVRKAAAHIFIPMTVGGGIRSVEDVKLLLRNGADKVAINTAAVKRPELITDIVRSYGSQVLVGSLQVKKIAANKWEIYTDCGRERTNIDAFEWAQKMESLGVGELLITSIDKDGTGSGFEIDFIRQVAGMVSIPVIASGGAGKPSDLAELIRQTDVDAIAVASMLHYNWSSIREIKNCLSQNNIGASHH